MAQRENLKTSWIYALRKEELINYLKQCDQDPSCTVEEMRRRLVKLATSETGEKTVEKLLDWQRLHEQTSPNFPMVSSPILAEKNEGVKSLHGREEEQGIPSECTTEGRAKNRLATSTREERIAIIELVQKWGLKYYGGKNVLKFLDQLEELASMYELDLSGVIPVMFELLRNQALVWFRNNHKSWTTWPDFRKDFLDFFLPHRHCEKREEEIHKRTQRSRENKLEPPPRPPTSTNIKIPTTPERGWLNHSQVYARESSDPQDSIPTPTLMEFHHLKISPNPLPSAISSPRRSPTPPPLPATRVEAECSVEQLPLQLQQEIGERRQNGTRVRLLREIDGHWYRINISRGGVTRVIPRDYKI